MRKIKRCGTWGRSVGKYSELHTSLWYELKQRKTKLAAMPEYAETQRNFQKKLQHLFLLRITQLNKLI